MIRAKHDPLYEASRQLEKSLNCLTSASIGDVPWNELINAQTRIMWEHNGKCDCGKRVFLFSECKKCLEDSQADKHVEQVEELHAAEASSDKATAGDELVDLGSAEEVTLAQAALKGEPIIQ